MDSDVNKDIHSKKKIKISTFTQFGRYKKKNRTSLMRQKNAYISTEIQQKLMDMQKGFVEMLAPVNAAVSQIQADIAKNFAPVFSTISQISQIQMLSALDIQTRFSEQLAPSVLVASQIQESMAKLSESFFLIGQKIQSVHEIYQNSFAEIADQVRKYGEIRERYMVMLMDLGWVPVTALFPAQMRELVENYEIGGKEAVAEKVDTFFVKFYDNDAVYGLFEQWLENPHLENRIPILQSAMKNHIAGEYWSSIPTLLPQIEGIVAHAKKHKGVLRGFELKKYYQEITSGDDIQLKVVRRFIEKQLLAGFAHGQIIVAELSRHAILHGGDTEYGTAANSLRAILLFDLLQGMIYEDEI